VLKRGANSAVHELAKAAVKQIIDQVLMKEIHRCCVYDIVLLVQHGLFL
jgi:hypothetical protein